jgi:fructose-1,6-bisphosphatase/inositol monophosphatase family enzyme
MNKKQKEFKKARERSSSMKQPETGTTGLCWLFSVVPLFIVAAFGTAAMAILARVKDTQVPWKNDPLLKKLLAKNKGKNPAFEGDFYATITAITLAHALLRNLAAALGMVFTISAEEAPDKESVHFLSKWTGAGEFIRTTGEFFRDLNKRSFGILIDTIDGSRQWVQGGQHWAVVFTLFVGTQPRITVALYPALSLLAVAVRPGPEGAESRGSTAQLYEIPSGRVTNLKETVVPKKGLRLSEAAISLHSSRAKDAQGEYLSDRFAPLVNMLTRNCKTVNSYSAGMVSALMVCTKEVNSFVCNAAPRHDAAAIFNLISAACGDSACFCDFSGNPPDFSSDERVEIVAGPAAIVAQIIAEIKKFKRADPPIVGFAVPRKAAGGSAGKGAGA